MTNSSSSLTAQAVSNLVEVSEDQPVTNSLIIAQVLERPHYGVVQLVRQHEESLNEFGLVKFEIAPRKSDTLNDTFEMCRGAIKPLAVAILNEQQATLLISFMSNTPKVVDFKIKLVKAFYDMRMKLEQDRKAMALPKMTEEGDVVDFIAEHCPDVYESLNRRMTVRTQRRCKDFEHVAHSMYVLKQAYKHIDELYAKIEDMNKCLRAAQTAMATLNAVKGHIFDMVDIAHQELGQCANAHPEIDELVRQKMMQ